MTNADVSEINVGVTLHKSWIWVDPQYVCFVHSLYESEGVQISFMSEKKWYDKECEADNKNIVNSCKME